MKRSGLIAIVFIVYLLGIITGYAVNDSYQAKEKYEISVSEINNRTELKNMLLTCNNFSVVGITSTEKK